MFAVQKLVAPKTKDGMPRDIYLVYTSSKVAIIPDTLFGEDTLTAYGIYIAKEKLISVVNISVKEYERLFAMRKEHYFW